jgi:hypothetical protein
MPREARRIIDAARERGISLRLMGGLGVRAHCTELAFCDRDYADLDMVGRRDQTKAIMQLFADLGYEDNLGTRLGTRGRQLQFSRACEHTDAGVGVSAHPDDHVDVFLDTFKMDHVLELGNRLELAEYTLPATDLLLTKLQIHKTNEKDTRDILTLLKDLEMGEDVDRGEAALTIDARSIAKRCSDDWGLYYDVVQNLRRADAALETYELTAEDRARLHAALDRLGRAIEEAPKSRAWRRRAKVGTRKPWYNEIEDQYGESTRLDGESSATEAGRP